MGLSPPEPIDSSHILESFDCGNETLNIWLRKRALANHLDNTTKTQVITQDKSTVVGFYSLCAGSVAHLGAPRKLKRNRPDPIPVIVLARLAVDMQLQGQGIGVSLLKHAYGSALLASESIGAVCLLVHAIDQSAWDFYHRFGFDPFPSDKFTLFRQLEKA